MFYAPAAFELFIFAFTAYRAYKDASLLRVRGRNGSTTTPFLSVLYRDGLICFFVMFAVRSWNIWIVRSRFPFLSTTDTVLIVSNKTTDSSEYGRKVRFMNLFGPTLLHSYLLLLTMPSPSVMWGVNTVMSTRVYLNLVWLTHQRDVSHSSQTTGIAFDSLTSGMRPNRLSIGPTPGWNERKGTGVEFAGMDTIDILTDYHTDLNKFTLDHPEMAIARPSTSGPRRLTRAHNAVNRV
jgi:hypothetical protein